MIGALQTPKSHQWLTIVDDVGHDVWKIACSSASLYDWMKAPTTAGQPPQLAAVIEKSAGTVLEKTAPVLEISNAAELRMGNHLQLRLALKNVNLTIGNTYIQGARKSATAGSVTIFIGHQRPGAQT